MRKILFLIVLTLMAVCIIPDAFGQGVVSRPNKQTPTKPTPAKPKLTVNGHSESLFIDFSDTGETKQLEISTNQGTPTVQYMPTWLSITGISAKSIYLKCEANSTTSSRDGSFEIIAGKLSVTVEVSQTAANKLINGHEWVDLGLPSGLKWATCNVGAYSPSDYGYYYAWGEINTKSYYSSNTCITWERTVGDISGNMQYDAARANWGGSWRLPTRAECDELVHCCTWLFIIMGNHNGYKVIGPNGNYIFLPATGCRHDSSFNSVGKSGYYWTATPYEDTTRGAYELYFHNGARRLDWGNRDYGQSVRPVSE